MSTNSQKLNKSSATKTTATRRCQQCIFAEMYIEALEKELKNTIEDTLILKEVIKTYRKIAYEQ